MKSWTNEAYHATTSECISNVYSRLALKLLVSLRILNLLTRCIFDFREMPHQIRFKIKLNLRYNYENNARDARSKYLKGIATNIN